MAKKRMFTSEVINTDKFLNISLAARGLYFHLNCEADDDGFISSALRTTRAVDGTAEMLDELVNAGYLIRFDSGIYLIRHWNLHNTLKKDRYTPTHYLDEKEQVIQVDKVYYFPSETTRSADVPQSEPQERKEKTNKGKYTQPPRRNSFHNFSQRDYDYDELEKKLLAN